MNISNNQIFIDLKNDGVFFKDDTIMKAGYEDKSSLHSIGWVYYNKGLYEKAMVWYFLSAYKNHSGAQLSIGRAYIDGKGVPVDYLLAMDWFLKASKQNNDIACRCIGELFEKGYGVITDKYKALEWYRRDLHDQNNYYRLRDGGYYISVFDTDKPIQVLIKETKIILNTEKSNRKNKHKKIEELSSDVRAFHIASELRQQEIGLMYQINQNYEREIRVMMDELKTSKAHLNLSDLFKKTQDNNDINYDSEDDDPANDINYDTDCENKPGDDNKI